MLRLAPSSRPLWRTDTSLQLGADTDVRLDAVTPWQERVLEALLDPEGVGEDRLVPLARAFGASQIEAERFVAAIGTALLPAETPALPVRAELPGDLGFAAAEALAHGWRAAGIDAADVRRWVDDGADTATPVILVADGLVDPRRAAALMARDTPHLPIELNGDQVTAGPVVVPGRTACLSCRHAERTESDPQWPLVAAQLVGRRAPYTDAALVLEAAVLSARLLRAAMAEPASAAVSVTLTSGEVRRVWRVQRMHAACLCRSPRGTASADAGAPPNAPTTTATGYARPA